MFKDLSLESRKYRHKIVRLLSAQFGLVTNTMKLLMKSETFASLEPNAFMNSTPERKEGMSLQNQQPQRKRLYYFLAYFTEMCNERNSKECLTASRLIESNYLFSRYLKRQPTLRLAFVLSCKVSIDLVLGVPGRLSPTAWNKKITFVEWPESFSFSY